LASGLTVINPIDITRMEKETLLEPKYKAGFDRNVYIWKAFEAGKTYLASVDVSRGDGEDFSTFHILEVESMEQVVEYKGKPDADTFSNMLYTVGNEYGGCLLVVENNTYGFNILQKLIDMEYSNLYYSLKGSLDYIDAIQAIGRSDTIPGFTTSMKTRPIILAKLEEYIRNKVLTIRSKRLISELKTFVWQYGKPQPLKGFHDDLIIPMGIACWIRETALIENKKEMAYKKAFLNAMLCSNTIINTSIPGQSSYRREQDFNFDTEMKRNFEQSKWLISKR
jgi:hypothetical protein